MTTPSSQKTSNSAELVSVREFERFISDHHRDMKEIKEQLISLSQKLDRINEEKLPELANKNIDFQMKTKVLWGLLTASTSALVALLSAAIFNLL
jgi:hypothetical protein